MKDLKIILAVCPAYGILHPPLSLACLTGFLRERDYDVKVLDLNVRLYGELREEERKSYWDLSRHSIWNSGDFIEKTVTMERIDAWAESIALKKPQVVGFSVYSSNLLVSLALAERLKSKNEKIKIIFGGPYMRRDNGVAGLVIGKACVDIVVVGEGEYTLNDIVDVYLMRQEVKHCPGAIIKSGMQAVDCGVRPPIGNLDSLPFSDFFDFDFSSYEERIIPLLASRGCVYNCAFCNEKSFWGDYRYRSAEDIVREIKWQILNFGIKTFRFNDLLINGNLKELERLCDRIVEEGLKISWGAYITARKMEKGLVEKMKLSGCNLLFMGIESGSQRILDKFKNGVKVEAIEELLRFFGEAGISIHAGWVVGFPDETPEDFEQTLDFIRRNRKYIDRVAPANLMSIEPGSPIYDNPGKFGVKRIINPCEYLDSITTLETRKERVEYFNKHIASG